MLAKHLTSILLLFFLVVIVNPNNADNNIIKNIVITLLLYIWFFVTTRTPFPFLIVILVLLIAVYLLDIRKQRLSSENKDTSTEQHSQLFIAITILILSITGFTIYLWEKKLEYKGKFSFITFFTGTTKCKAFTPKSAKLI